MGNNMYREAIPRRASAEYRTTAPPEIVHENLRETHRRRPFKRYFLVGALLMLCGYVFFTTVVRPFVESLEQQWHYGDAPIFSLDADVGHKGVSHFLSLDWQRQ